MYATRAPDGSLSPPVVSFWPPIWACGVEGEAGGARAHFLRNVSPPSVRPSVRISHSGGASNEEIVAGHHRQIVQKPLVKNRHFCGQSQKRLRQFSSLLQDQCESCFLMTAHSETGGGGGTSTRSDSADSVGKVSGNMDLRHFNAGSSSFLPAPPLEVQPAPAAAAQSYCVRWRAFRANMAVSVRNVAAESGTSGGAGAFADVTLACDEGHSVRAHRLVLAACSDLFRRLLKEAALGGEEDSTFVLLAGVSPRVLDAILAYLYSGEVVVSRHSLADFFR